MFGLSTLSFAADDPAGAAARQLINDLASLAYVESVDSSTLQVRNHEVGLGALQKVRGSWRLDRSERISGELERHTWRVLEGYAADELLLRVVDRLAGDESAKLLFSCDARACGQSVQWANRMFGQRVLYGTESSQRYRVYALEDAQDAEGQARRLLLYSSARSTDRQYLHLEVLSGVLIESAL
jgi:hypothetical protein